MSPIRVGIAVEDCEVVAVRVRKREAPLVMIDRVHEGEALSAPVGRLLDLLGAKSKRVTIGAVVGNGRVRFGELFGVPPTATEREARQALEAEPTAFFVGERSSLVPGTVWRQGECWIGVVADRETAEVFEQAAAARRCNFSGLAPCADFTSLRDAAAHAAHLSPDSECVVDVLGAERMARARRATRARALVVGGLALAVIGTAPLLSATLGEREAAALVARTREVRSVAFARVATVAGEAPVQRVLVEAASGRGLALNALEALSRALPDSSAVVWFESRGEAGSAEVVAVDGADVVASLAADSALRNLRLDGSISRETANGQQRDRIRVSWGLSQPNADLRGRQ
jgi:hypothetical protein